MNNTSLFAVVLILLFGIFAVAGINAYHGNGVFPSFLDTADMDQAQNHTTGVHAE